MDGVSGLGIRKAPPFLHDAVGIADFTMGITSFRFIRTLFTMFFPCCGCPANSSGTQNARRTLESRVAQGDVNDQ
jgi:hypothetical protein